MASWIASLSQVFGSRRVLFLAPLGFAAGLPVVLTSGTLYAWLASQDVDLRAIGMFSLIGLPFALKFLWAPLLDYVSLPWLGRRRGWIVATQIALVVALGVMGALDVSNLVELAIAGVVVAFLSANHIAAIDAYRTDVLPAKERAAGAATYLLGFRVAGVAAGGLAVTLAAQVPFRVIYWLFAAILALTLAVAWMAPALETVPASAPTSLRAAVIDPWRDYLGRPGAFAALALVLLYRLGESLAGPMITPMLFEHGYDLVDIGSLNKGVGLLGSIAGAVLGGAILSRWYLRPALLAFGVLQSLGNLGYAALVAVPATQVGLGAIVLADNLFGGMATGAFIAWLMSLCSRSYSATQYALLYGVYAGTARLAGLASGFLASWLGWTGFFVLTALIALPGLALLRWLPQRIAMPEGSGTGG